MAEGLRIPITVDFKNSLQKLNDARKAITDFGNGAEKSLSVIATSASSAASALTPLAQAAASAKSAIIAFGEGKGNIETVIPLFQELVAQAGGIDQAFELLQDIPFFEEFVRGAEEAVLAAERLDGKDVSVDVKSEGIQSVKAELRQANIELQNVIRQFGEASPQAQAAAARVEELGDVIEAARRSTEGADFAGKFALAGKAISGVSAAFQTATALQAVFGSESKKTEEALKKVQAVMALTQGIQGVVEAQKAFTTLGAVASNALKGIKTGIAATGIGLLLVALGTIVAYWDEIKEAVSGVSEEQENLIKTQGASLKLREQELESIDNTEETLKRQGKSEKEILQIKAQKVAQVLKERQELLKTNIEIRKAQVEAAERNFTFTKGIIMMLTSPLQVILGSIDIITRGLKAIGAISEEQFKTFGNLRERFTSGLTGLLFDPKAEKEAADKATKEDEAALVKLQNQYDGYLNNIDDLDKDANQKATAKALERAKKRQEALGIIRDSEIKLLSETEQKKANIEKDYEEKRKKLIEAGISDFTALNEAKAKAILEVETQANDERLKAQNKLDAQFEKIIVSALQRQIALRKNSADLAQRAALAGIKNEYDRRDAEIKNAEQAEIDALNEKYGKKKEDYEQYWIDLANIRKFYQAETDKNNEDRNKKEEEDLKNAIENQKQILASGIADAASAFGEALATGADPFQAAFKSIAISLGNYLQQLGKQAILASKLFAQLRTKIFSPAGIGIGIALVALGALIKAAFNKKAEKGFASGGYIDGPGTDISDSIPARLSKGEYVIRARSVRRYGKSIMDKINKGEVPLASLARAVDPSRAIVNRSANELEDLLKTRSRAIVNRGETIELFSDGGLVGESRGVSRAIVNRSMPDFIPYDFSRAIVNRPAPNVPQSTEPQIIATTKVSGQDLKIILERADRRYSNVT